jgi:hypothetical protein
VPLTLLLSSFSAAVLRGLVSSRQQAAGSHPPLVVGETAGTAAKWQLHWGTTLPAPGVLERCWLLVCPQLQFKRIEMRAHCTAKCTATLPLRAAACHSRIKRHGCVLGLLVVLGVIILCITAIGVCCCCS